MRTLFADHAPDGGTRTPRLHRKRLLIVSDDSKPRLGGVAEYLHGIAVVLSCEHDVRFLTPVVGAPELSTSLDFDYVEARIGRGARGQHTARWIRVADAIWTHATASRRATQQLQEHVAAFSPDLLLIGRLSPGTAHWAAAARQLDLPYAIFAYGLELVDSSRWMTAEQRRACILAAARLYSISSATTELLLQIGVEREKIVLVPPGIEAGSDRVTAVLTAPVGATPRSPYGSRRYVMSLCRLVARKGVDLALRAFAQVADEFPDVDYVVAGTGPEEANLRTLASQLGLSGRIRFLGAVDEMTKQRLLSACELFLMPNRRFATDVEGFGIVFLEAALHGKAVIGGANGGVVDAVIDGCTGILVDTSDGCEPTADALRRLLRDEALRSAMGSAALEHAARFTWSNTTLGLMSDLEAWRP